ncbi:hypothetical protein GQ53DRAFT_740933 [Thozetella sp. PMI_491]|nr:hypothetical protein GQ53DRAFT_740933 [Thozetella sp. PMI_491]
MIVADLKTDLVGEVSSNHFLTKVQDAVVADSQGEAQREMPSVSQQTVPRHGRCSKASHH